MGSIKDNFELLIVDDDEMTIFLHEVHVKENNFHSSPKIFYNGKDALDYFNTYFSNSKSYCVMLDINMPIMNGWDFMDAIKEKGMDKNVSVIILTSSINTADKIKAKKYDMVVDYVEKPLSIEHLNRLKTKADIKELF
jgi:DNA-binding response OmpR family regulator